MGDFVFDEVGGLTVKSWFVGNCVKCLKGSGMKKAKWGNNYFKTGLGWGWSVA